MAKRHSMLVYAACLVALTLLLPAVLTGSAEQTHIRLAEAALLGEARQAAVPVKPEPVAVKLQADGQQKEIATLAKTVAEFLDEQKIELGEHDRVDPLPESALPEQGMITVYRVKVIEETTFHRIYFHEVRRPNTTMELGATRIVQQGKEGRRAEHYRVVLEDGVEVERTQVGTEVLVPRVDRIVEFGTIGTIVRDGKEYRFTRVITVQASAYTAGPESTGKSPGHPLYGITRSGLQVEVGHIAVDPRVIPLLTSVYVEGLDSRGALFNGVYLATDTGRAILGNRIDIYFENVEDALWFGRRQMKVYILE